MYNRFFILHVCFCKWRTVLIQNNKHSYNYVYTLLWRLSLWGGGGFYQTLHFILEKGCPNLQTFHPI